MGTRRSALDAVYLTRTHDLCGGLQGRAGPFWQDFFTLLAGSSSLCLQVRPLAVVLFRIMSSLAASYSLGLCN
jgi:hypothetical protein